MSTIIFPALPVFSLLALPTTTTPSLPPPADSDSLTSGAVNESFSAPASGGIFDLLLTAWRTAFGESIIKLTSAWIEADIPGFTEASESEARALQGQLSWLVGALVIASIMVAAATMAWNKRGESLRELFKSLFTLVIVSSVGLTAAVILVRIADSFAHHIMSSLGLNVSAKVGKIFGSIAFSPVVMVLLGLIVVIANLVQIFLLFLRSALLPVLAALLPVAAAASSTSWGKEWFNKLVSWFIAFTLFKPVAAIIYAMAFRLMGSGSENSYMGLFLMLSALVSLPAMLSVAAPAVSVLGEGASVKGAAMTATRATGAVTNMVRQARAGVGASSPRPPAPQQAASGAARNATTHTARTTATTATRAGTKAVAGAATAGVALAVESGARAGQAVQTTVTQSITSPSGPPPPDAPQGSTPPSPSPQIGV